MRSLTILLLVAASCVSAFPSLRLRATDNAPAVSGGSDETLVPTVRSIAPCPAISTAFKAGFLGKSTVVTKAELLDGMFRAWGTAKDILEGPIDFSFARFGYERAEDKAFVMDLRNLSLHGFIEHDASLTRLDSAAGDAVDPDLSLINLLVSYSSDGKTITTSDIARFCKLRASQSAAAGRPLNARDQGIALGEAAFVTEVFGRNGSIPISYVYEFFALERFPLLWKRPQPEITGDDLALATAKITAIVLGDAAASEAVFSHQM